MSESLLGLHHLVMHLLDLQFSHTLLLKQRNSRLSRLTHLLRLLLLFLETRTSHHSNFVTIIQSLPLFFEVITSLPLMS